MGGSGDVFVNDRGNSRVSVFGSDGVFKRAFGKGVNPAGGDVCTSSCQVGSSGAGAGQLSTPVWGGGERVG